jgi:AbrB family looped-hinge helix DNA binding protein
MSTTKIKRTKQEHTFVYIPSFIRDKFNLKNGDDIDVDIRGGKIIITPLKKE